MDSATPTATRKSSASVESAAATATANGVNVNVSIGVSGAPAAPVHTVSASTAAAAVVDASQDFSVHVSNLSVPDYAVFQLWLRGCSGRNPCESVDDRVRA